MTQLVKCIQIDAKNKEIKYVDCEIPIEEGYGVKEPLGYKKAYVVFSDKSKKNVYTHICYKDGSITNPKDLPDYGFHYRSDVLSRRELDGIQTFDADEHSFTAIFGNAILASYKQKRTKDKGLVRTPIDVDISLEDAHLLVGEFNNGIWWRIPEFTCMLNESFAYEGYELLLRMENEGFLYGHYAQELTKPIQTLNSQMITFEFNYHEVTIITGRIENLEQYVRVEIFESDRSDLRCIAAATMVANKVPSWIRDRLRAHFFEKLVKEPFVKKMERDRIIFGNKTVRH
jgi:hypothetical protein